MFAFAVISIGLWHFVGGLLSITDWLKGIRWSHDFPLSVERVESEYRVEHLVPQCLSPVFYDWQAAPASYP